jgi:hypothetical protein
MEDSATQIAQKGEQSNKKGIARFCIAIAVSLLFFSLVPPAAPSALRLVTVLIGFVMLGLLLYGLLKLILVASGMQIRLRPLQRRAILLLGVCLPLLLIMLQSIGQLTIRDTLTLGGVFVVGIFYVLRIGRGLRT